ncbi:hypothetical protein FQA39_LY09864 [Lamprigera yunnana]|nr:hypothetical protein FQA39_LY09864 [Lamprigera yunnana]
MPTESREEIELSNNFDNVSNVNNNKSAFYERKRQSKVVRVLIVLAYVLSVSLAAIILSAYYVFVWDGKPKLSYQICEQGEMDHGRTNHSHDNRTDIVIPDFVRYKKISSESRILDVFTRNGNERKSTTTPVKRTSGIIASQINCETIQWSKSSSTDGNVKFAGEEAKDRLYEPKHKKKVVRVLTVVAYIFFVSLAAIMLSLYYVFIWNGHQRESMKPRNVVVHIPTKCDNDNNISKEVIRPTTSYEDTTSYVTTPQEENSTWLPDLENDFEGDYNDFKTEPIFIKKLFGYRKVKVK